ncbi:MAG TPA: hypothetical protein ENI86_00415 [Acidimicrobiales bacterium]|nr:hypothetical protein [Acidimicrobiales bacterium]
MTAAVEGLGTTHEPSVLASSGAVAWRGVLRTLRFPAIIVQSIFFPAFFLLVYTGLYRAVTELPNFPTDRAANWYLPFMMMQGAAFSGVGAGFATAVDIDNGFFDRLLLVPGRRISILLGTLGFALVRAVTVAFLVMILGLGLGARFTDAPLGLPLLFLGVAAMSLIASCYSLGLIYRVKDQRVAPMFQVGIFVALFVSTAQVPLDLATGWLHDAARFNPVTNILRLGRQAFLTGGVTWTDTWGGLVAVVATTVVAGLWAYTGLRKYVD